jgi:hypothetical protein
VNILNKAFSCPALALQILLDAHAIKENIVKNSSISIQYRSVLKKIFFIGLTKTDYQFL